MLQIFTLLDMRDFIFFVKFYLIVFKPYRRSLFSIIYKLRQYNE